MTGAPTPQPRPIDTTDRSASGLSEREAADRLERFGPNELPSPPRPGWLRQLAGQLMEPMSLLLLAAAAVEGPVLGEQLEGSAILAIVLLNGVIGTIQEGRAQRALDALRSMEPRYATVIREGRRRRVALADVVPGDLVVLSAGERVPADADLVNANALEVDESMLTGESLPVGKSTRDDAARVYAGTIVTRGDGVGVATATGASSSLGVIAAELGEERAPTPLQRKLHVLTRILGIGAVGLAATVFVLTVARSGIGEEQLRDAFLSSVALAVAAVPEGLPAVITVSLALGVRRMAERGAIIRRLPAVETLGSATVILTDKTGTLTENRMAVDRVVANDGGAFGFGDELPADLARAVVLGSDATIDPPTGDPLEIALLTAVGGERVRRIRTAEPRLATVPFDAATRRSITISGNVHRPLAVLKGAPEVVLEVAEGGRADAMRLVDLARGMARSGERVIAFAVAEGSAVDVERPESSRFRFAGLVGLRDPVRGAAAAAVSAAAAAGIRIVMVTGDHAGTASSVAREVGIITGDEGIAEGRDLGAGGDVDPDHVAVYARVLPHHKLDIVRSFQARGDVVAVTGDGVNDAPALRQADIGVAMGRTGSDVAREAADMVLTDDDLDTIVDAVQEGRRLFGSIRKVVDYLVAGNLSEVAVVIGALVAFPSEGAALTPLQLLWINLLTDGLPAVALGAAPGDDRPTVRWDRGALLAWRTVRVLALRAAAIAGASLGTLVVMRFSVDASWEAARTAMFTVLVLSHLLYGFAVWIERPGEPPAPIRALRRARGLLVAVGAGVALQVTIVVFPSAHAIFDLGALGGLGWLVSAAASALSLLAIRLLGSRP